MLRREGNGVSSGGNGVLGNGNDVSLDEDTMTFGEHGSSAEGKRAVSTTRVREFRKRQKLGLLVRTIRTGPARGGDGPDDFECYAGRETAFRQVVTAF